MTDRNKITEIISNVLRQNNGRTVIFNIVTKNNSRIDGLLFKEIRDKLYFASINGASLIIDPDEIKEIRYYAYGGGIRE